MILTTISKQLWLKNLNSWFSIITP